MSLHGTVLTPHDLGYDTARSVWNAMVDRRPALIVRCATTDDVVAAVRYARERDLEIGVRGGGHSMLGLAVPDGGLMIDLSPLGAAQVDPGARRARVGGGALLGTLDRASQAYGLATPAGNVSHTGVGGLTLGGGTGWLSRLHGMTCDNVESFEVVTADGTVRRASAHEHPDLFWGLRGGGGNFGIVTEFRFRLHPVGTRALVARVDLDPERAVDAVRAWRDLLPEAPRQATFLARSGARPSIGYVWVGDPAAGRRLLPALERAAGATGQVALRSYVELQSMDDDTDRHGLRCYSKDHYFRAFPDEAVDAFLYGGGGIGARLTAWGGAIRDVPDDETPFSHRSATIEFITMAQWSDPAEDADRIAAARRYAATLASFATGTYVNALADPGQAGIRRAYSPATLARLVALKDRYDPDNAFHLNPNIQPSGQSRGSARRDLGDPPQAAVPAAQSHR